MSQKITASIIGPTGYVGLELIRLLIAHPNAELKHLVSHSTTGTTISALYPHLKGICDLSLIAMNPGKVAEESDIVFLALPHGESQKIVPELLGKTKIIDLSGDFRLKNMIDFTKFYGFIHGFPQGIPEFTYGLPEVHKEQISHAKNIANPGCFAITAQLALYPIMQHIKHAHVVAVTGSSGSGKTPSESTHHPIRSHNMKSYKIGTHQHIPEILQTVEIPESAFTFIPTSGPFVRGIHLTASINLKKALTLDEAKKLFEKAYASAPFVRIKPNVELSEIIGSNYCDIAVSLVGETLVVQAVIDNLVKGAAGTAIQNMNLICNFEETMGLASLAPLFP